MTVRKLKRPEETPGKSLAAMERALQDLADQNFALDQHAIVAVTGVQGASTYVNDKVCAISQYSRNEDILLVEDSQNDNDLALYALREEKLAITFLSSGTAKKLWTFFSAAAFLPKRSFNHPPKLVLLDLKLPKVDGLQVLKELKNDSRSKSIPVVIMTSSSEERDLVEGYNLGVNSYIQKPVDFEQFRNVVKTLGLYWLVVNQSPMDQSRSTMTGASH